MKISQEQLTQFLKDVIKLVIPFVKKPIESFLVRFFLDLGRALLITGLIQPCWEPIVLGLFDKYFNINLTAYVNVGTYTLIFFGILFIVIALVIYKITIFDQKVPKKKPITIYHNSVEEITTTNTQNENCYEIDLCRDLRTKNKSDVERALEEQYEKTLAIKDIIKNYEHSFVTYCGLASIPFTLLLGYCISDKYNINYCEWDNNRKEWIPLTNSPAYPSIKIFSKFNIEKNTTKGDIIIRASFTQQITDDDINPLNINALNIIDFQIEHPCRGIINSTLQVEDYQNAFRKLLDNINTHYPNINRIHMFISAQPSLVFAIGSKISERMDPDIIVYEYSNKSTPKYQWGIKLSKYGKSIDQMFISTSTK